MIRRLAILLAVLLTAGCKESGAFSGGGSLPGGPNVSSISPTTSPVGAASLRLTVEGANFATGCSVRFNGSPRPTILVSSGEAIGQLSRSDLASQGIFPISISNPDGSVSNVVEFVVGTVASPTITSLDPSQAQQGSPGFTLAVGGLNFAPGSVVRWNGGDLSTAFVSAQRLSAAVPASDLVVAGTEEVSVFVPGSGGGVSNSIAFTVTPAGPVNVSLDNFMFNPKDVTVFAGQTVIYTNNQAGVHHTVSKDVAALPGPDENLLAPGNSYTFVVPLGTPSGTNIFYHCNFHGAPGNGLTFGNGMAGVLRVR